MKPNSKSARKRLCCGTAAVALLTGLFLPWNLNSQAQGGSALRNAGRIPAAVILNVSTTAVSGYVLLAMKDPAEMLEDDLEDAMDDLEDLADDIADDLEDEMDEDISGSGFDDDEEDFDDEFSDDNSGSGSGDDEDAEGFGDESGDDNSGSGSGDEEDAEGFGDESGDDNSGSGSGDEEDSSGSGSGGEDEDDEDDSSGSNSGSGKDEDDGEDKKDEDDEDRSGRRDRDDDDDDRSGSGSGRDRVDVLEYSEITDDDGFLAADRELLILVERDDLERGDLAQAELEIEHELPALDMVMVRVRVGDDDDMFQRLSELETSLGEDAIDLNHSYSLEAEFKTAAVDATPAALARPLLLAGNEPASLRIGVVDSTVDATHSALSGAAISARDFADRGQAADPAHGTMIASIITGVEANAYRGIAPGSQIFAANVFFTKADGTMVANVESMILALNWLVGEDVGVINMSLSGPPNRLLERAIARARAEGVIIVAAVGNAGPAAAPLYPAAYDGVVAVTAIGSDYQVYRRAVRGDHVDFAAPGVDIYAASSAGGYGLQSGTSLAAPFVTVALAASAQRQRNRPWDEILGQLQRGAIDLGATGFDPVFGYGLIRGPN